MLLNFFNVNKPTRVARQQNPAHYEVFIRHAAGCPTYYESSIPPGGVMLILYGILLCLHLQFALTPLLSKAIRRWNRLFGGWYIN